MDRAEFEAEAMAWADAVYRVARWMTGDPHLAEDLVQETYLRAFKGYKTFAPGTDCRAWLLRILRNAAADQGRRKRLPTVDLDGTDPTGAGLAGIADKGGEPAAAGSAAAGDGWGSPEAWTALLAGSTDDSVFAAVQSLAEPLRQAFCLVVLGECSYREAADILGCAEGTIKSRLSRACSQLRSALAPKADSGNAGASPQRPTVIPLKAVARG
jgi:RNA polymerase sigma-70 factor (ECF subfamily)